MHPEETLRRLCRRYGVPLEIGGRLLPLVERAAAGTPEVRRHLLAVVKATLAHDAAEVASQDHELARRRRLEEHLDRNALVAVARVLHRWGAA